MFLLVYSSWAAWREQFSYGIRFFKKKPLHDTVRPYTSVNTVLDVLDHRTIALITMDTGNSETPILPYPICVGFSAVCSSLLRNRHLHAFWPVGGPSMFCFKSNSALAACRDIFMPAGHYQLSLDLMAVDNCHKLANVLFIAMKDVRKPLNKASAQSSHYSAHGLSLRKIFFKISMGTWQLLDTFACDLLHDKCSKTAR